MSRVFINQLHKYIGQEVSVSVHCVRVRDTKNMQFLVLRDISGTVQAANYKPRDADIAESISKLPSGSFITVYGKVVENSTAKPSGIEIQMESYVQQSLAESPLPIDDAASREALLDYRQLALRRPEMVLTMKVQTAMEHAMRNYWLKNGFLEIHSPKLMSTSSESGAELFTLPYFGTEASLAQSPQFYKQMAMASGLERVFEIGPVFRANKSRTPRHDTEFTSVDTEMSWISSHEDVMAFEEQWLAYVLQEIKEQYGDEIKAVFGVDVVVPEVPFPRVSLEDAYAILSDKGHNVSEDTDMDPKGERLLSEHIKETYGHEFVFITGYPVKFRPFYHMVDVVTGKTKSFDLLWKGVEITTGAQREHRLDVLIAQAKEKGYDLEPLNSYLDFFRYGCPPHGGFGVGLTRLLMLLLERESVRDVTYVFRGPNRLTP